MRPVVFEWQALDSAAVSSLQTVGAAGNLAIDGTLSSPIRPDSTARQATFGKTQRQVTLTSVNDLHLVNFTISGYLNGKPVSETRAGPTSNTVATTQLFNIVTSISFNAAVTAVKAGISGVGNTDLYTYDHHVTTPDLSAQVVVSGTITYDFQVTNDDANNPAITPTWFTPVTELTNKTDNRYGSISSPIAFARINVTAGTGSLVATLVQQGFGAT
jgi:hypothetical protein